MTYVTGCANPRSVSILIRGGTEHVTQEVERSLQDALKVVSSVLEDGVVCPGGGATEIDLSVKLRKFAPSVGGREQLAVEEFAQALEVIPWALAENGGYDAINTLIELRGAHDGPTANRNVGVNLVDGKGADMWKLRVVEPARVKRQALSSAVEVADMILRIDDVIASKKHLGRADRAAAAGTARPGQRGRPAPRSVRASGPKSSYRASGRRAPPCAPSRSRGSCVSTWSTLDPRARRSTSPTTDWRDSPSGRCSATSSRSCIGRGRRP